MECLSHARKENVAKLAMVDQVSFICKRTVVSTKPVQLGKTYSFSALDRLMEHNRLRIIYYYRTPLQDMPSELTKKLRESLSVMLSYFPMVTGRLKKNNEGQWMITCNDAGVRMVETRAKGSVEEWLQSTDREKELQLVHWEDMFSNPYYWSTFYVQVTEFEGGGLAVGLSCTHLLADPICATMFLKAWADTNFGGKMLTPPLFHPLPPRRPGNKDISHKPYTQLIDLYKSCIYMEKSVPIKPLKFSTVTFMFTEDMVRTCMSMANIFARENKQQTESTPSPFEALAGLFWVSISKVKGMKERPMDMSICLDMRKVLGLDKGYFGNCMVHGKVNGEGLEISKATMAIKQVIDKMDNEGIMDLIEWLDNIKINQSTQPLSEHHLVFVNLDCNDPYAVMFQRGHRLIRFSYYVEPTFGKGQVLILPGDPCESLLSRKVMVTLLEDEASKLCEDDLIASLGPTIVMG